MSESKLWKSLTLAITFFSFLSMFLFFNFGMLSVDPAGLKLQRSSCLCLLSSGTTRVSCSIWLLDFSEWWWCFLPYSNFHRNQNWSLVITDTLKTVKWKQLRRTFKISFQELNVSFSSTMEKYFSKLLETLGSQ